MVAELSVGISRIDGQPEAIDQLPIADTGRVEGHLDGFQVSGSAAHHLFVGGIGRATARETRDDRDNAGHGLEIGLDGPEAPAGEHRRLAATAVAGLGGA